MYTRIKMSENLKNHLDDAGDRKNFANSEHLTTGDVTGKSTKVTLNLASLEE